MQQYLTARKPLIIVPKLSILDVSKILALNLTYLQNVFLLNHYLKTKLSLNADWKIKVLVIGLISSGVVSSKNRKCFKTQIVLLIKWLILQSAIKSWKIVTTKKFTTILEYALLSHDHLTKGSFYFMGGFSQPSIITLPNVMAKTLAEMDILT